MKLLFALVLAHLVSISAAARGFEYTEVDYVGFSCKTALASTAKFCKSDDARDYECYCSSDSAMGSFLYCANSHLESKKHEISNHNQKLLDEFFQFRCPNTTVEHMRTVYANASDHMVNTSLLSKFNKTSPINFPVYANASLFDLSYRGYVSRYSNFKQGFHWGAALVGYWGIIMAFGMISNLSLKFAPSLTISLNKRASQLAIVRWYRKNVSIPATFGSSHTKRTIFQGLLPTRLESFIVFVFCTLCIIFQAVGYHHVENTLLFASKTLEMSRLIGDRTALISNFLMTITYLFAGRNQLFITLTGWKQSTFVMYHKWAGRMLFLSVLAHTIAMLISTFARSGVYGPRALTGWWRWGSVAVVAGGIIFVQAFSWLREKNYEVFLYVHIFMAIAFLIGAWKHLDYFNYGEWAYATAAVWVFDRFIRLVRIFSFGIKTAKVCIVSNETLQITVDRGSWWPFFPGAFGYLHILKGSVFWQSHPFTVVKTDNNELRFYIKIKRGVTETMYKELLNKPNYTGECKIAVEGPYGDNKPAQSYDQVLLYSGGNGIPGPFAYAKELGKTTKEDNNKFVKLYWVIRHWHSLDWFLEELQVLEKFTNVQTIIYVTRAHEGKIGEKLTALFDSSDSQTSHSEKGSNEKGSNINTATSPAYIDSIQKLLPHIEFREGRPNMQEIVNQDIDECHNQNAAIITCAHSDMCDEIRRTVADKVGDHKTSRVDFFEELQTW
ncbi:LANO_0E06150g1_1 [Lachancea nothofagi CBS 11611]|uniref:LANO_0E06150g1_1 n=1 Tax=Lachancea nothofagi CBS 11611 TaxID=1266666 RepID=A0A1G4JTL2_9SACH|nr:LANO_0E06150g1_1 [Lachancea nothofagi CBS 11611]